MKNFSKSTKKNYKTKKSLKCYMIKILKPEAKTKGSLGEFFQPLKIFSQICGTKFFNLKFD